MTTTSHLATFALDSVDSITVDVDEIDGEKYVYVDQLDRALTPSVALQLAAALNKAARIALPALNG